MADDKTPKDADKRSWVRMAITVLVVLIALPLIIFNLEATEVWVFGLRLSMPLFVILAVMFLLGMLLGGSIRAGIKKMRHKS
jgi:uncharacterized integral membrane protein